MSSDAMQLVGGPAASGVANDDYNVQWLDQEYPILGTGWRASIAEANAIVTIL